LLLRPPAPALLLGLTLATLPLAGALACKGPGPGPGTASGTDSGTDGGADGGSDSGDTGGGWSFRPGGHALGDHSWGVRRSLDLWPDDTNVVGPIRTIAAGGQAWASSLHNPDIVQIDLATATVERVFPLDFVARDQSMAVDPVGGSLWIAGGFDRPLTHLDLRTGESTIVDGLDLDRVAEVAWDDVSQALLVWGENGRGSVLLRIDSAGGHSTRVLGDAPIAMSLDTASGRVLVSTAKDDNTGELTLLDSQTLDPLDGAPSVRPSNDLLLTPEGAYVAIGPELLSMADGVLSSYALAGHELSQIVRNRDGEIWGLERQADIDPITGIVWGTLLHITPDGSGEAFRGGYNSQYLSYSADTDLFVSNSEGTSQVFLTAHDGHQSQVSLGQSACVARPDPVHTGRVAVVDRLAGHVHFFDGQTEIARYDSDGWPADLCWSGDGERVYVYEHHRDRVVSVDPLTGAGQVIFDDPDTNSAVVFGGLIRDGDTLYVASGATDRVRAMGIDGSLLWQQSLGDPQPFVNNDEPGTLDLGLDGDGHLWVSRSRDGRVLSLDAGDGHERGRTVLPEALSVYSLFVQGSTIYAGPYRIEPATIELSKDAPLDAQRVLARSGTGTLLLDDGVSLGWQGGERYEHTDDVTRANYQVVWDPALHGVWLSRFALGKVELIGQ